MKVLRASLVLIALLNAPHSRASQIFISCEHHLDASSADLPKTLRPVGPFKIPALERSRTYHGQGPFAWTLRGPQNAARFEAQLLAIFEDILMLSLEDSEFSEVPNIREYHIALNGIRNFIKAQVAAMTDPRTGYIHLTGTSKQNSDSYKEAELAAVDQLKTYIDDTVSEDNLRLSRSPKFDLLRPIPHFRLLGEKMKWRIELVPDPTSRGFTVVSYPLDRDDTPAAHLLNLRLKNLLTDTVFAEQPPVVGAAEYQYHLIDLNRDAPLSAESFFKALTYLSHPDTESVDAHALARGLLQHANMRLYKYFTETNHLIRKLNGRFATEARRRYGPKIKLEQDPDGTYHFDHSDNRMYLEFMFTDVHSYPKDKKLQARGWDDIKYFAKTYCAYYNEEEWDAAIANLREHLNTTIEESMLLSFSESDHYYAQRAKPLSIKLQYQFDWTLFEQKKGLESIRVTDANLQLRSTDESLRTGDLSNLHLELVIGRIIDQLERVRP